MVNTHNHKRDGHCIWLLCLFSIYNICDAYCFSDLFFVLCGSELIPINAKIPLLLFHTAVPVPVPTLTFCLLDDDNSLLKDLPASSIPPAEFFSHYLLGARFGNIYTNIGIN